MSTDSTPGLWTNKGQLSFFFLGGGGAVASAHLGGGYAGFCLGIAWCVPCATLASTNLSLFQGPTQTHIKHVLQFLLSPTKKTFTPLFFPTFASWSFHPPKTGGEFTPQKRGVWADRVCESPLSGVHVLLSSSLSHPLSVKFFSAAVGHKTHSKDRRITNTHQ